MTDESSVPGVEEMTEGYQPSSPERDLRWAAIDAFWAHPQALSIGFKGNAIMAAVNAAAPFIVAAAVAEERSVLKEAVSKAYSTHHPVWSYPEWECTCGLRFKSNFNLRGHVTGMLTAAVDGVVVGPNFLPEVSHEG